MQCSGKKGMIFIESAARIKRIYDTYISIHSHFIILHFYVYNINIECVYEREKIYFWPSYNTTMLLYIYFFSGVLLFLFLAKSSFQQLNKSRKKRQKKKNAKNSSMERIKISCYAIDYFVAL